MHYHCCTQRQGLGWSLTYSQACQYGPALWTPSASLSSAPHPSSRNQGRCSTLWSRRCPSGQCKFKPVVENAAGQHRVLEGSKRGARVGVVGRVCCCQAPASSAKSIRCWAIVVKEQISDWKFDSHGQGGIRGVNYRFDMCRIVYNIYYAFCARAHTHHV
jgi:hypothetical protein